MDEEHEQEEFDAGQELWEAVQGDMSVDDYCWRVKALADALAEQGEPVDDGVLTLHMLRGVSPRFEVAVAELLVHPAVPSFMEAFARLSMKEFDLDHKEDVLSDLAAVLGGGDLGGGDNGDPP
jgi:hypothetical protein